MLCEHCKDTGYCELLKLKKGKEASCVGKIKALGRQKAQAKVIQFVIDEYTESLDKLLDLAEKRGCPYEPKF